MAGSPPRDLRWWKIAAGVLGLVAAGVSLLHFREKAPAKPEMSFTMAVPENSVVQSFVISPDGRHVVIAAAVGGMQQLWLRALDANEAEPYRLPKAPLIRSGRRIAASSGSSRRTNSRKSRPAEVRPNRYAMLRTTGVGPGDAMT